MAVGVGTNVRLAYGKEATRGTLDVATTTVLMRATGRNINLKKDLLESNEVSSTRQRVDVRHGFNRIEGEIGFELSLDSFNGLIALAMGKDTINDNTTGWVNPTAGTTSVLQNGNSTANTFEVFESGGDWIAAGYRPGDWVVLSSATELDLDDIIYQVVGVSQTILTVNAGTNFANLTLNGTITDVATSLKGRKIGIGTTLKTISIQRGFTDVPLYQVYLGCTINSMSFTVRPDAMVGGTMSFIGISGDIDATTSVAPFDVINSAKSNSPFSAFDGSVVYGGSTGFVVGTIVATAAQVAGATSFSVTGAAAEQCNLKKGDFIKFGSQTQLYQVQADCTISTAGGSATLTISPALTASINNTTDSIVVDYTSSVATITALDFTLDNQRSLLGVVGSKFSSDVYEGVAKVTGTVTMLLSSQAQLTMFESELTPIMLTVRFNELGTSEFMSVTFYRAKLTSVDIDPPQNGPVLQTCQFEALEQSFVGASATFREVLSIQRSTTTNSSGVADGSTIGYV